MELKFSLTRIQVALQTISQLIFSGLDGGSYEAQLAEIIKNLIHILFSCSASYTHHYASYTHWPGESLKVPDDGSRHEYSYLKVPISPEPADWPVAIVDAMLNCTGDGKIRMQNIFNCFLFRVHFSCSFPLLHL